MAHQGVSRAVIDDAYRIFLGRPSHAVADLYFEDLGALISTLFRSEEFKSSLQSRKNALAWPEAQYFFSRDKKIIYCPIGKNACTFFKQVMVKLAEHPHQEFILHNVHMLTDHVSTGMQLSDCDMDDVEPILSDPNHFKFAILRDPAQRLLSAYIEKFVKNRQAHENVIYHTSPVIRAVQAKEGLVDPDYFLGISFRSLVEYIVQQPKENLDPHWCPQYLYLGDYEWSNLYTFDMLPQAVTDLEQISGMKLSAPPANKSGSGIGNPHSGADQLLPCELDKLPMIAKESFLTPEICTLLNDYYARDYDIIQNISRGHI